MYEFCAPNIKNTVQLVGSKYVYIRLLHGKCTTSNMPYTNLDV